MQRYCSGCEKHTNNICPNIKLRSRYADFMANKSFFDEIKHKSELQIFVPQFLTY